MNFFIIYRPKGAARSMDSSTEEEFTESETESESESEYDDDDENLNEDLIKVFSDESEESDVERYDDDRADAANQEASAG